MNLYRKLQIINFRGYLDILVQKIKVEKSLLKYLFSQFQSKSNVPYIMKQRKI